MASMASKTSFFLISFLLHLIITPEIAQSTSNPKAILFQTSKDESSKLHLTTILQKNPPAEIKVLVDLGAQTLWLDCQNSYNSSSYKHVQCNSTECAVAEPNACGDGCQGNELPRCIPDTCYNHPANPIIDTSFDGGRVSEDELNFQSTNGSNPGNFVTVPKFIFTCVPSFLAAGLPIGAIGIAGFGRTNISLTTQLARTFNLPTKFGVCLSSSPNSKGVIIIGDGPYYMLPNIDVTSNLIFTPLIVNPNGGSSTHSVSKAEYFITVKSIEVNGKKVEISKKLFSINKNGDGGTKINTYSPYTVLEPTIYKALTDAFATEMTNITNRVPSIAPFGFCFNASGIASTRVGPAVPTIDLILEDKALWRIFGANSMVQVSENVMCLGFVGKGAGRISLRASIDIGTHQLEDNLLQFDVGGSRLGFSSSLLFRQTTCANFNFKSIIA
ncbi:protease [Lithospermum erythrorhizon]|uniref:Protease n=1 Tax=Lithospermum erythrorhizon TaxID=34254 RepID=A0AAV3NXF1_LITER